MESSTDWDDSGIYWLNVDGSLPAVVTGLAPDVPVVVLAAVSCHLTPI